jgi:serine/threonine-protein kinase
MLKSGDRIGDWIVEEKLGSGGMGAVYRARSALTPRLRAALKLLRPEMDAEARARFVREAEALAALRHPAIVRVMGISHSTGRGFVYLVMELAEGETLKARLERGPLPFDEALSVFVPLASGLEHAHQAGIYHRDLKPGNIILVRDGSVRLVDFGIAAGEGWEALTSGGHLGTVSYLPPEIFRGEKADPEKIDIYGFALCLHEALTGRRAFPVESGLTPHAAVAAVGLRKVQQPALDLGTGFPEPLRQTVLRATDPDPAKRPSMQEMRQTLEQIAPPQAARRVAPKAPAEAAGSSSTAAPAAGPAPRDDDEHTTRVPDPARPGFSEPLPSARAAAYGRRRSGGRLIAAGALTGFGIGSVIFLIALLAGRSCNHARVEQSQSPSRVEAPAARR